jgi:ketosteroid isomerase-like protein
MSDGARHPNAALIDGFYAAFRARDAKAMAACYQPDATFRDPVFEVSGKEIADMWSMLCERGRDLTLEWRDVRADATAGFAHWEPRYTFSVTGRPVHNRIDSHFTFRDGKIATHADSFSLWRWTRMALGPKGAALGWAPFVKNAIRAQARSGLARWQSQQKS